MKPAPFTYHRPATADEAVGMLDQAGEDTHVLAGGQSLIPMMNFRVAQPAHLVDINFIDELDYIRADDGWLAVGARVRQAAVERSEPAAGAVPLVTEALSYVAHPPVRHRATVAGSIAHADPAAELPAVLLALDGEVVVRSREGERRIRADDLYQGPLVTAIAPGELLTEVRFPSVPAGSGHGVCGTCTVLMNGETIRSCITFAVQADGAEITTVESLAQDGRLHPLQEAFWEKQGLQCGYCTPGMLLRAHELLRENPQPSAEEVREGISSNLCRCTGYQFIVEAVLDAAERMRAAPTRATEA